MLKKKFFKLKQRDATQEKQQQQNMPNRQQFGKGKKKKKTHRIRNCYSLLKWCVSRLTVVRVKEKSI